MTVKQLMNKLKKLSGNAIITIYNDDLFVSGEYAATEVDFDADSNTVMIDTDHKKRICNESEV